MTRTLEALEELLARAPASLSGAALYKAWRESSAADRVHHLIERAGHAVAAAEPTVTERRSRQRGYRASTALLATRQVAALTPQVKQCRLALFGDEAVPFSTLGAAARWIKDAAAAPTPSPVRPLSPQRLRRLVTALERRYQRPISLGVERRVVPFEVHGSEVVHRVHVPSVSSPLAYLSFVVTDIHRASGFAPETITTWVLTGRAPVVPPVSTSIETITTALPNGGVLTREDVVLRVHAPDIDVRTLHDAFYAVRRERDQAGAHALKDEDRRLIDAVRQVGPRDEHAGEKYWRRVARRLGDDADAWDKWRKRWARLPERLRKLGLPPIEQILSTAPRQTAPRATDATFGVPQHQRQTTTPVRPSRSGGSSARKMPGNV